MTFVIAGLMSTPILLLDNDRELIPSSFCLETDSDLQWKVTLNLDILHR